MIVGFTAGIAVLIFSEQIAHFLGLRDIQKHESFILNIAEIGKKIGTFNLYSILIAGIALAILLLSARLMPKIPGALVALLVSTAAAVVFFLTKWRQSVLLTGKFRGSFRLSSFRISQLIT